MVSSTKFNLKNVKNPAVIIKLVQIILGIICFSIVTYHSTEKFESSTTVTYHFNNSSQAVNLVMESYIFAFLSFWLFVASLFHDDLHKTVFEAVIGILGFTMLILSSLTLLIWAIQSKDPKYINLPFGGRIDLNANFPFGSYVAASVIGGIDSLVFLASFLLSFRAIRAG